MGSHINCLIYKDLQLIRGCHLAMYDKNHKNYKLWCYKSIPTYIIHRHNRNIITEAHYYQLVIEMNLSLSSTRNSHFWIRGQLTRGCLFLFLISHLNQPDFAKITTSLNFKSVLHFAFFSCHFSTKCWTPFTSSPPYPVRGSSSQESAPHCIQIFCHSLHPIIVTNSV